MTFRVPVALAVLAASALAAGAGERPAEAPILLAQAITTVPMDATVTKVGAIEILSPWARATPPGQKVGAVYLVLRNTGSAPLSLTEASTPAAGEIVFHDTGVKSGFMQMQRHDGAIEIPPGGEVELKPGGLHLMLVGMRQILGVGTAFPVSLGFSDGTKATVEAAVWDVGMMRTTK